MVVDKTSKEYKDKQKLKKAEYYEKNKHKWTKYRETNKDKGVQKLWYQNNRERLLIKQKKYGSENKEKIKEYSSDYATGKNFKLYSWKKNGLIDDYDLVWERYCNTKICDLCNVELTLEKKITTTRKCMDHCHKTGIFRNIVCHKCNMARKELYKSSKSGHKGVFLVNDSGRIRWRYKSRRFKTKKECLCYKFIYLMKNL